MIEVVVEPVEVLLLVVVVAMPTVWEHTNIPGWREKDQAVLSIDRDRDGVSRGQTRYERRDRVQSLIKTRSNINSILLLA